MNTDEHECTTCGKSKPALAFPVSRKGTLHSVCRSCQLGKRRSTRRINRLAYDERAYDGGPTPPRPTPVNPFVMAHASQPKDDQS